MNVGLFVPFMNNFGKKGFYNSQEIGLAKEIRNLNNKVFIFKLIKGTDKKVKEEVINENILLISIPAKNIGINGLICDLDFINKYNLKKLVMFSDTQIIVNKVYKFCKCNGIDFIPYIGVIESNSNNKIVRQLMKVFINRNIKIYKNNNKVLCKTPTVMKKLNSKGIKNTDIAPVGLDFDLLKNDFEQSDKDEIKQELGYGKNEKIILFIGRLEKQKNPLQAIDILKNMLSKDKDYRMVIIGKGLLKEALIKKIKDENLEKEVRLIPEVENSSIWKYYKISECFINLNSEEIYGMAILESMYYRCPVIAVKAPGPNYILSNKKYGVLLDEDNKNEFINIIFENNKRLNEIREISKEYVEKEFSWGACAKKILE